MDGQQSAVSYTMKTAGLGGCFELSLTVPEFFPVKLTDFELWADGRQVGPRTPVGQVLRDLIIRRDDVKKMWIRLYSLDAIACDCMIDPDAEGGELSIK